MAAGLGFKTFTTGEVLTAADTNGYLMQGSNVFASTAARDAAITSPQEGQFAFTKDTNGLWYYDGAAWVASGATGDIEGVTAGVGITGGGTSGTVTITNDMATTITAAGDIVVGTGSGTYDNLPIGTTGQLLTADTTVSPYKVKWATPAAGGSSFEFINRTTFSNVASQAIDGVFTSTYQKYYVAFDNFLATTNTDDLQLQFRYAGPTTQTSTYYGSINVSAFNANIATTQQSNTSQFTIAPSTGLDTFGSQGAGFMYFSNVGNSTQRASYISSYVYPPDGQISTGGGEVDTTRLYTGFLLKSSSTNITGTVTVYGLKNS